MLGLLLKQTNSISVNMAAKKQGGKRKQAGRKPIAPEDKKVVVTLYISKRIIDKIGLDTVKQICYDEITNAYA